MNRWVVCHFYLLSNSGSLTMENISKLTSCTGCGADFQQISPNEPGYLPEIKEEKKNLICYRCHKLMNQNLLLTKIPNISTKDLVVTKNSLVIIVFDLTGFPESILDYKMLNARNVWLVGTKLDIFPQGTNVQVMKERLKNQHPDLAGYSIVSNKSSDGVGEFINGVKKFIHKEKIHNITFVGYANSGKTSLVNKLLKMSRNTPTKNRNGTILTYSTYPGTTVKNISFPIKKMDIFGEFKFGNITDTPGVFDENANYNLMTDKEIFEFRSKIRFVPRLFEIPKYYKKSLFLGGLGRLDITNVEMDPLKLIWFGPRQLIPKFVTSEKVSSFWSNYLKGSNVNHGPPYIPSDFPEMKERLDFTIIGKPEKEVQRELVLKNIGWFNILKKEGRADLKLYSPLKNSFYLREPFVKLYDPNGIKVQSQKFFLNHVLKARKFVRF
eukprot:NODE_2_length_91304_cov_0.692462.p17 type:complete len:439 gc:universal NODE_2_length_91304_cov_0.692462:43381-42065(-)